jgi:hypothetical protein
MDFLLAVRSLWRFFRGRCPVHNVRYAASADRQCDACREELGPHLARGSMWD